MPLHASLVCRPLVHVPCHVCGETLKLVGVLSANCPKVERIRHQMAKMSLSLSAPKFAFGLCTESPAHANTPDAVNTATGLACDRDMEVAVDDDFAGRGCGGGRHKPACGGFRRPFFARARLGAAGGNSRGHPRCADHLRSRSQPTGVSGPGRWGEHRIRGCVGTCRRYPTWSSPDAASGWLM